MLKKLFKYDFKALSKRLWPVQIAVVAGSLLAGGCLAYDLAQMENFRNAASSEVLSFIINMIMVLILVAVASSAIITLLLTCSYFNRSLLGDEGYLSFTLPVRTSELLWSKIWVGFCWAFINLAAVLLGMLLFAGIGLIPAYSTTGFADCVREVLDVIRQIGPSMEEALPGFNFNFFMVICTLYTLVSEIVSMIMIYFVITAAFNMTKRHRVLVAVGLLIAISIVMSILSSVFSFSVSLDMGLNGTMGATANGVMLYLVMGVEMLITIGVGAALYFWMHHLLDKKLNLE